MDRKQVIDPGRMLVQLNATELAEIIEAALQRALSKRPPDRLHHTLEEAAKKLAMVPTRLAHLGRTTQVPFHRLGQRYYFTETDLLEILAKTANQSGT